MSIDDPTGGPDRATISRLVVERQGMVYGWLEATSAEEGSARGEGERRVALGALRDRLATFARLLERSGPLTPTFTARAASCLEQFDGLHRDRPPAGWARSAVRRLQGRRARSPRFLDVEAVREVVNDVDLLLLELAGAGPGDSYLRIRVEEERRYDGLAAAAAGRREAGAALSWSDLYDPEELAALSPPRHRTMAGAGPEWPGDVRQRVLELLGGLYQARQARDRGRRAQEQLRTERLRWVATLLAAILLLAGGCLAVALAAAGGDRPGLQAWIRVPLAGLMGALGAGLASARVLREEPVRADALPRFKAAFLAQLPIGGAFGLVALALQHAGVLPAFQGGGVDRPVVALVIYAFLAGYSEPFVLGILRGLSGRGDPDRPEPPPSRTAPAG